jgi:hypothetical protein
MNAKKLTRAQAHDVRIDAHKRKEAEALVMHLADLIMQSTWLSAEVARQWCDQHGYYLIEKKQYDAEKRRGTK